jgi:hypothetical protein
MPLKYGRGGENEKSATFTLKPCGRNMDKALDMKKQQTRCVMTALFCIANGLSLHDRSYRKKT